MHSMTKEDTHSWYVVSRNSHITTHTKKSLLILFAKVGMEVFSFCDSVHSRIARHQQTLKNRCRPHHLFEIRLFGLSRSREVVNGSASRIRIS